MKGKNMKMRILGMAALTVSLAGIASATDATASLNVSASVANNCTITTAAVNFGAYDPIATHASSALNGSGSVTVKCTTGASAAVKLGQGSNADSGSTAAAPLRRMKETGSSNYLSYALYSDTNRSTVWEGSTGVSHTGDGTATQLTVYGQVASNQNVPAGSYSDTVVATVTF